ncbi:hypothetical protein ETU10_01155 [Apibacter muscae]|nr:hypothetical protein [Apibacter muscae]TWP25271.1 hypothetical protein ETU10_01155 [Apibacter muscae]
MGNKQFSPVYELAEEEYRRNLFYFICFDQYLFTPIDECINVEFEYLSTIIPPVIVPIEFRYDKISENNDFLKIRKVGTLKITPEILNQIQLKYDEIHKPNIKFGFTEYKLEFRVRLEFNKKDRLVETADLFIMEQIADNIDNSCEFHLKRLQNFTK